MAKTSIEWTGHSWNPIVGCSKVSPGCTHCYAEAMARRLKGMGRTEYQDVINGNGRWTGKVALVPERLEEPLRRRKPTTYFVNSMSDLFHSDVDFDFVLKVFSVMWQAHQHTFQVLTKRPERMLEFVKWMHGDDEPLMPLSDNVWLGVSVENQQAADERIPFLLQTPAAVRFVSCEPLLGSVDLFTCGAMEMDAIGGVTGGGYREFERTSKTFVRGNIDWAIVGGESGLKASPMHPDWARSLRDQCQSAGVPFFFKQWGMWKEIQFDKRGPGDILLSPTNGIIERLPDPFDGNEEEFKRTVAMRRVRDKKEAGRLLDGREWNQIPERKE